MGDMLTLTTADGHELTAYRATPENPPKGGIVVIQEIFGVTDHIRHVADRYASLGYLAIAPSLFDRIEPGIALSYSDIDRGREIMQDLDLDKTVVDVAAGIDAARSAGKVAAIGYCWGGAIADLAACRTGLDAAVSYYGRMTVEWLDEQPRCPVMYHYGADDALIPPELVDQISAGREGHPVFLYQNAGHGFNCDERADFSPESAQLALERTLEFLGEHLN